MSSARFALGAQEKLSPGDGTLNVCFETHEPGNGTVTSFIFPKLYINNIASNEINLRSETNFIYSLKEC